MLQNKIETLPKILGFLFIILGFLTTKGQHLNRVMATLDGDTHEIGIQQEFTYVNDSQDTLTVLYFNDWANAYVSKKTPLAHRFEEEFKKSLHLAKEKDRGSTQIISAVDNEYKGLQWERSPEVDLIKFKLNHSLAPKDSVKIFLTYNVKLPPNKYTPYGYDKWYGYYLKDWYLTPAVYNGEWQLYSNKNLEDLYTGITNTIVDLTYPERLFLTTNFDDIGNTKFTSTQQATLKGTNRKSCEIILSPAKTFTTHVTPTLTTVTDIETVNYEEVLRGVSILKVSEFLSENLGKYPHQQLLVSELDYDKNPLYGINQLPSFIRPYGEQFQFEMKFLKTALYSWMRETMFLNPRKEEWVNDAIVNYLMFHYVETYYPDQKLLGKLSKIWGVRSFHLAQVDFNEQYPLLYTLTARKNLDQALSVSNDSLIKFNQKIANPYKAGLGLAYLSDYIGKGKIDEGIKTFYKDYSLKPVTPQDFENILSKATDKDIHWFFNEYVTTDNKIDFKIKKVVKTPDSLQVTLKNKQGTNVPISLFGLENDSVVSKYWFPNITTQKTFTIPRGDEDRLVLNYDQRIPEYNQRDNWKTLNGFLSSNKKLKFQFYKDIEDPYYNQIFYVPVLSFNIYDGLSPGLRVHNKTFLEKPFQWDFSPSYAPKEKSFIGYGRLNYRHYHGKTGFYVTNYSLGGSTSHFEVDSRYSTVTPSIGFGWKPDDLMSNKRSALIFRYVNVFRNVNPTLNIDTDPDYSVFDARFIRTNNGIINYMSWFADAQQSSEFTKIAFNVEYRRLFDNNMQFNIRLFAGKFLRNTTDSDYFSFALDRPTDYLFDYNYIGRSEDSGISSQQIIIAEGGFKSKLAYPYANDWMATTNTSVNVWRWIELYGDLGFVKNKNENAVFVYDSGVRLNLLTDYFELYFPVYSNNGWEIAQPNYAEKIRFVITLSPKTLLGLFNRQWF